METRSTLKVSEGLLVLALPRVCHTVNSSYRLPEMETSSTLTLLIEWLKLYSILYREHVLCTRTSEHVSVQHHSSNQCTAHLQDNFQADWMPGCRRWVPDAAVRFPPGKSMLGPLAAIAADRLGSHHI